MGHVCKIRSCSNNEGGKGVRIENDDSTSVGHDVERCNLLRSRWTLCFCCGLPWALTLNPKYPPTFILEHQQ